MQTHAPIFLDSQHSRSRSVDHASDVFVCLDQRAVPLMEAHSFTENHVSTEQDYGKIAKSYAHFTIIYSSATTVALDGCEQGSLIKDDTHLRRGGTIYTVVSFTAETECSGKNEKFVPRDTNKQRLIPMITDELREI